MRFRWTSASLLIAALAVASLPLTANAAPLPAPVPQSPTAGATVDQPVFSWAPVSGAKSYEIEVALDDQFVTLTDPALQEDPEGVAEPLPVNGTTYVPTRTYSAKTHYWHARAVASDGSKGQWSSTREFTRRWTNDDEPAGTESDVPASRVESVQMISGGDTPPLNLVGITWDPVPGASYYEVAISVGDEEMVCKTPHTTLIPPFKSDYSRRAPLGSCALTSPLREWTDGNGWIVPAPGSLEIDGDGAQAGDLVYVRFLDSNGKVVVVDPAHAVAGAGSGPDLFTVPLSDHPADPAAKVQYFKVSLPVEAGQTYAVRVRAVDVTVDPDYPGSTAVFGMWSNECLDPCQSPPASLTFTPGDPQSGTGSPSQPVTPLDPALTGTDVPLLRWDPASVAVPYKERAVTYQVTVALDRDFTNEVATYLTRTSALVAPEVYDDHGPVKGYYWYATPCVYKSVSESDVACRVPRHLAINNPGYIGRFSKQSAPLTGLTQTEKDAQTNALLRWGDALTAAQAEGPGGLTDYQVQFTTGDWAQAVTVRTDNLAYSTAVLEPSLKPGTYRWRVRPRDGQGVPLAWAYGPDFTIVAADDENPPPSPSPSPSSSAPNPIPTSPVTPPSSPPTGPPPVYQPPDPAEGTANGIPPTAPGTPKVTKSGKKKLRVKWRASEELGEPVSEYLVYRSTDGQRFTVAKRTTAVTLRLAAKRGTTYWFYIVADSGAGRSEPSGTSRFRMPVQSK